MSLGTVTTEFDDSTDGKFSPYSKACPVSLLVVSDVRLVREGIARALDDDDTLLVMGTAAPDFAEQAITRFMPDVALVDMRMGGALDAARSLRSAHSALVVVALGATEADTVLLECAQAGIAGFVAPGATSAELSKAVHGSMRGELVCTPRLAGILLSSIGALSGAQSQSEPDPLTPREHEIALLLREGLSNKQIAFALGIQNATVKNHVHNLLGKLRLTRRSQVAVRLRNSPNPDRDVDRHFSRGFSAIARTATAQA